MQKNIKRLLNAVALCSAAPLLAAEVSSSQAWPQLRFPVDRQYPLSDTEGRMILVDAPLAAVRGKMAKVWPSPMWDEKKEANLGNNYDWQYVWLRTHPDRQKRVAADCALVQVALEAKAITAEEAAQLLAQLTQDHVTEGQCQREEFSLEFSLVTFDSNPKKSAGKHDYIGLVDVTQLLHTPAPTTLLWFGSEEIIAHRRFSPTSEMIGVVTLPIPSSSTTFENKAINHPAFIRQIEQVAATLPLKTVAQSQLRLEDRFREPATPDLKARPVATPKPTPLVLTPVNFEESFPDNLKLVATHDDHLLVYGKIRQVLDLCWQDGALKSAPLDPSIPTAQLYPSFDGYWAVETTKAVFVSAAGKKVFDLPQPQAGKQYDQENDWELVPRLGLVNSKAAIKAIKILHVDGRMEMVEIPKARTDALDTVFTSSPYGSLRLADSQPWLRDAFISRFNPQTKQFEKALPHGNLGEFGSLAGGWSANCDSGGCEIHDLEGKAPPWKIDSSYNQVIARTAHGRLMAIATEYTQQLIWDMQSKKPIACFEVPKDKRLTSLAFSWRGDKVWLLYVDVYNRGRMTLGQWDIPQALQDGADENNVPDHLMLSSY